TLPAGSGGPAPSAWPDFTIMAMWSAAILPQLELQSHYDLFDFTLPPNNAANRTAVTTPVGVYVCPSDVGIQDAILDQRSTAWSQNPSKAMGLWYFGSQGPTDMDTCPFCPAGTEPSLDNSNYCCQGWNFGSRGDATRGFKSGAFVGMFGRHKKSVRFRQVTDGLASTILLGETLPQHCRWACAFCTNFCTTSTNIPINTMENEFEGSTYNRACGFKSK